MHPEESNIDGNREGDEAGKPGHKVLHGVEEGPSEIAKDLPQLRQGV